MIIFIMIIIFIFYKQTVTRPQTQPRITNTMEWDKWLQLGLFSYSILV